MQRNLLSCNLLHNGPSTTSSYNVIYYTTALLRPPPGAQPRLHRGDRAGAPRGAHLSQRPGAKVLTDGIHIYIYIYI